MLNNYYHLLGAGLPAWFVSMTAWTGGLLVLAYLADRLLRDHVAPGPRMLLYAAVLARALLPADWHAPLGPTFDAAVVTTVATAEPVAYTLLSSTTHDAPTLAPASPSAPLWGVALLALYALITALLLIATLRSRVRLAASLRHATPARPRVADLSPGTRVLEADVPGPLACGILRPTIVLPAALIDELSDPELACVLAHERAHLRRRDPLLSLALSITTAALWPLLPVWLAAAKLRQLIEQAADTLATAGGRTRLYGETILKLASGTGPRHVLASGLQLGGFGDLRGRLLALRTRPRWPRAAQTALAAGVAGTSLACSGLGADPEACPVPQDIRCAELEQIAQAAHDLHEQSRDPSAHDRAAAAYDEHAAACANDPDHADMLYHRAELAWSIAADADQRGDVAAARAGYTRAHEAFVRALEHKPARFTRDAAYAQMLARRNALAVDIDAAPAPSSDNSFPRSDYTADELALLASYDLYARHVTDPADTSLHEVLLHRARLAMRHNRFDDAEAASRYLVAVPAPLERQVDAAEILTDVLTIRWTTAFDPSSAQALAQWLGMVTMLPLYAHHDAAALRDAVPRLQAGVRDRSAAPL